MSHDTLELDFSGVKDFAPIAQNVPKGNYKLKVAKIEATTSKAGNPMWVVDSEFVDGVHAGQQIREYLTLTDAALFKVKSWLEALGLNIGKKKVKLPNTSAELMKKFGGKLFGAHIDDGDPYTNDAGETKTRSEIKYHLRAAEVDAANAAQAVTTVTKAEPQPAASGGDDGNDDTPPPAPAAADEPEESGDVADQLDSFDLDDL